MIVRFIAGLACLSVVACDYSPKSSQGFRLPDGDIEAGRAVYVKMQCASCHAIEGREVLREGIEPEMTVPLGGMTTMVDTYGQLVTSVINPSHKIARTYRKADVSDDGVSKMRNYNDVMTVTELIDLVAFVQDQYEEFPDY